jgi:hypothetical protein
MEKIIFDWLIWVKLKYLIRCQNLIILLIGQINFIRGIISEKFSLKV